MATDRLRRAYEKYVIRRGDGCWGWSGSKMPHGYGRICIRGEPIERAHRASYVLFVGEIPAGMCVCHACDNPECSNPDHLFLGTMCDNMRDCVNKGRFVHVSQVGESNGRSVMTYDDVLALREAYDKEGFSSREWATRLGVTTTAVLFAAKGLTWKSKAGNVRKALPPKGDPGYRDRRYWKQEEIGA